MAKIKHIDPVSGYGYICQRLLQAIQGIYDWNGDLFYCPYNIDIDTTKNPFSVKHWVKRAKDYKNVAAYVVEKNGLLIFGDPVDPAVLAKRMQRTLDGHFYFEPKTKITTIGNTIVLRNTDRIDKITFVRKLTEEQRKEINESTWNERKKVYEKTRRRIELQDWVNLKLEEKKEKSGVLVE